MNRSKEISKLFIFVPLTRKKKKKKNKGGREKEGKEEESEKDAIIWLISIKVIIDAILNAIGIDRLVSFDTRPEGKKKKNNYAFN